MASQTVQINLALKGVDVVLKGLKTAGNAIQNILSGMDVMDALTNAENELFGTERLLEALNQNPDAAPDEVLGNVMDGISRFVDGAEQFDDITMLSFQYNGPAKGARA